MSERRRTGDRLALLAVGIALAALAITAVAFIVGLAAIGKTATIEDFQREGHERRDQTCLIFERDQLREVQQLRKTYEYLLGLTPAQRREPLNQAVLQQLPELEGQAREDDAPPYCDEPGVEAERRGEPPIGLPEPDARPPARPDGL